MMRGREGALQEEGEVKRKKKTERWRVKKENKTENGGEVVEKT